MKRVLLIALISSGVSLSFAQTQIGNSGFETWETVPSTTFTEPTNWNSFLTASGSLNSNAANQIEQSTDVRPGTSGVSSARIYERLILGFVKANGNLTLGRINMGNAIANTPNDNYNASITADPNFSEALTDTPDSLVFWAKYVPTDNSKQARVKASLHDDYDYHDPEGTGGSATHIVATAVLDYSHTNNAWKRFSIPFDYTVATTANPNTYILITFTTNKTPGGGTGNDVVFIDDVELIYNPATSGISKIDKNDGIVVGMDNSTDNIIITSVNDLKGSYKIYNTSGQEVQNGAIASKISFDKGFGAYFVHLTTEGKEYTFEILKD